MTLDTKEGEDQADCMCVYVSAAQQGSNTSKAANMWESCVYRLCLDLCDARFNQYLLQ